MKVKATISMDVDLKDLAATLAKDPEEFARFWFHFAEATGHGIGVTRREKVDLEPFGKALAPEQGGIRRHAFSKIYDAMVHHVRTDNSGSSEGYK